MTGARLISMQCQAVSGRIFLCTLNGVVSASVWWGVVLGRAMALAMAGVGVSGMTPLVTYLERECSVRQG